MTNEPLPTSSERPSKPLPTPQGGPAPRTVRAHQMTIPGVAPAPPLITTSRRRAAAAASDAQAENGTDSRATLGAISVAPPPIMHEPVARRRYRAGVAILTVALAAMTMIGLARRHFTRADASTANAPATTHAPAESPPAAPVAPPLPVTSTTPIAPSPPPAASHASSPSQAPAPPRAIRAKTTAQPPPLHKAAPKKHAAPASSSKPKRPTPHAAKPTKPAKTR